MDSSAIRFCKLQSDILRRHIREGVFITTNGMFSNLDNHRMQKYLAPIKVIIMMVNRR